MATIDIIRRLRHRAVSLESGTYSFWTGDIEREAADEMERLYGIILAARERLEKIVHSDELGIVIVLSHEHLSKLSDELVELWRGLQKGIEQ